MGEMEGTYRVLHTPGIRSGAQSPGQALELGQHLPAVPAQRVAGVQEKRLPIRVQLLDGTVELFDIEPKCNGQELLTQLWQRLNVIESDYFGLEFQNVQSYWVWLEPMKPIIKQVRRPKNAVLRLAVKFFPPDPGQLQEEYTRYLFALQLKRDLLEERLTCNETTAALLAAHLLQSEIGDYDEVLDREHLQAHKYLPGQGHALEKILEFHRKHMGQTPAESDFQVLEIARKLEMYGIRFHLASDREGTKIHLAVSHMGVLVFQGTTKINTFNWSKVRKLSFKRKRFLIKLHPEVHGPYQDTLEFLLGSRDECKNFWKICVEYHTFFRIFDQPKPKAKAVFFSRGSSFRYSGRTQKQLVDYVKDSGMKKIPYERRHSKTRASLRALSADLPKQSISFTEGMRTWASPFSANASFCSAPASPVAPSRLDLKNSSSSLPDPQAPTIRSPAAERSPGNMAMASGTSTGVQPCQGVGLCPVMGRSGRALALEAGKGGGGDSAARKEDSSGSISAPGLPLAPGNGRRSQRWAQGRCMFTTASPLQVTEEFIDDDPAEISFFAGGSEAFSFPYGVVALQGCRAPAKPTACPSLGDPDALRCEESVQSSPDRYSTEAVHMDADGDSEFEEEEDDDLHGDSRPSDTSELFEVKAQASLMQSLLSPSETSSLRNNQSETSSLSNVPLHSVLPLHVPSSAEQSGASSMVNFPACSIRSASSSAFQFSDILDQLEQLSYPPTATEGSSSPDLDSWDSEAEGPLDGNLFFSNPFAQTSTERFAFDLQNNLKNLTPEEPFNKSPC